MTSGQTGSEYHMDVQEKIKKIQLSVGENRSKKDVETLVEGLFAAMLDKSAGVLTDEILDAADELYLSCSTNHIASVLNLRLVDLQKALKRERSCECPQCGNKFTQELEPRKQHSYRDNYLLQPCITCKRAERKQAEIAHREREREWKQKAKESLQKEQEIAEQYEATQHAIVQAIESDGSLWNIETFRKHIHQFARQWISHSRVAFLHTWGGTHEMHYPGCMVCGSSPVTLCLVAPTTSKASLGMWLELVREVSFLSHGFGISPTGMTYAHEVLWWTQPSVYFSYAEHLPLLQRPLLCLCAQCKQFFSESHPVVYPAWFNSPSNG